MDRKTKEKLVPRLVQLLGSRWTDNIRKSLGLKSENKQLLLKLLDSAKTVEECEEIIRERASGDSAVEIRADAQIERILRRQLKEAGTFKECWKIYTQAATKSQVELLAYKKSARTAKIVEDCQAIIDRGNIDARTLKLAENKKNCLLARQLKKAKSDRQCQQIWKVASVKSRVKKQAEARLEKSLTRQLKEAKTFGECQKINDLTIPGSKVRERSYSRMQEFLIREIDRAKTVEECLEIGECSTFDRVQTRAHSRAITLAKDLADYSRICKSGPNAGQRRTCIRQMAKLLEISEMIDDKKK